MEAVPEALAQARVLAADGEGHALGDAWSSADAIVIFVRHFACAGCSEHLAELRPRLAELAALGVRVVVVGNGTPDQLAAFVVAQQRELVRLLRIGGFVDHERGTRLVTRGEPLDALLLVVHGSARVALADRAIEITDGTFVGELGFLTGKPPGADVEATTPLRVVRWPLAPLREFIDANPDLRATMQQVLGSDLATKLRR